MPRRDDPERVYQAQRYGVFIRLTQNERVDELDAEHWISRWEPEAEANGPTVGSLPYWDAAWRWIEENRRKQRRSVRREWWRLGPMVLCGQGDQPLVFVAQPRRFALQPFLCMATGRRSR